jgi:hypothetical protein
MKNLKLFSILCLFVAVAVIGCKKGDTGPAGPAGASGSDSVLHSAWVTLALTQDVDNAGDTSYDQTITATALNSSILNNGVVLSYLGLLPSLTGLTDTLVINTIDLYTYFNGAYLTQDLSPQLIELYANVDFSGQLYRYVLIPSSVLTNGYNGTVYTKAQLKAMTYAQVQKTFGIKASTTN